MCSECVNNGDFRHSSGKLWVWDNEPEPDPQIESTERKMSPVQNKDLADLFQVDHILIDWLTLLTDKENNGDNGGTFKLIKWFELIKIKSIYIHV